MKCPSKNNRSYPSCSTYNTASAYARGAAVQRHQVREVAIQRSFSSSGLSLLQNTPSLHHTLNVDSCNRATHEHVSRDNTRFGTVRKCLETFQRTNWKDDIVVWYHPSSASCKLFGQTVTFRSKAWFFFTASTIINDRLWPKKSDSFASHGRILFFSPMPYIMADSESEIASKGSSHHKGTDKCLHACNKSIQLITVAQKKTQKRLACALQ
jgi:hypothetical protein